MIISAIINLAVVIVSTILLIFPASDGFPASFDNAINYFAGYVGILDPIVPIDTLSQIIALVIIFEIAVFTFKGFKWILSHVPWVGGKG